MPSQESPVRVFVGTDRSQSLAVRVLEHSIRKHTRYPVEVTPMLELPVRPPRDPAQDQRTGFSFSRFCIPRLAGYRGRAIYMDADMLVFKDIAELWEMSFDGAKVLVQEELSEEQSDTEGRKGWAPKKRVKQCSVMLLDCGALDWDIERIIDGLDEGRYDYAGLMYHLCLLTEEEIGCRIPFRWNSLEHWDESTALIHYTDMGSQPWVFAGNPFGSFWIAEVREMLTDGSLSMADIEAEVRRGYFRPSLLDEVKGTGPYRLLPASVAHPVARALDKARGYRPHWVAYRERRQYLESRRRTLVPAAV